MASAAFFTLWYLMFWNKVLQIENLRKVFLKEFLEGRSRSLARARDGFLSSWGIRLAMVISVFLNSSLLRPLIPFIANLGFFTWRMIEYSVALEGSPIKGREVLLDVGPYYSCFPSYLASQSYTICVDIMRHTMSFQKKVSKTMGRNISERLECVIADATRLPFRDDSFDKIFMISTVEHIGKDKSVAKESGRLLKEDGCCIISFPFSRTRKKPLIKPYFQRFYTRKMILDRIVIPSSLSLEELFVFGKSFLSSFFAVVPEGWFVFKDLVVGLILFKLERILCKNEEGTTAIIKLHKTPACIM